jgi:hypothetical protein
VAKAQEGLAALMELRDEYQDWRDNLPENLDQSPVAEKLDAILDLDFDGAESFLSDAEGADLPRGFGRD